MVLSFVLVVLYFQQVINYVFSYLNLDDTQNDDITPPKRFHTHALAAHQQGTDRECQVSECHPTPAYVCSAWRSAWQTPICSSPTRPCRHPFHSASSAHLPAHDRLTKSWDSIVSSLKIHSDPRTHPLFPPCSKPPSFLPTINILVFFLFVCFYEIKGLCA